MVTTTRRRTLADLRREVAGASALPPLMELFFDLSEGSDLMARSRPCAPAALEPIVREIGARLLGRPAAIEQACWLRVEEEGFVHGALLLGGVVTTAFWFDEPGVGLLAMAAFGPEGMHFARFQPVAALPGQTAERQ
jgi:hypothetical protein